MGVHQHEEVKYGVIAVEEVLEAAAMRGVEGVGDGSEDESPDVRTGA